MTQSDPNSVGTRGVGAGAARTQRSRSRWLAVAVAVQAIVMAAGWALMFREVRGRVASTFKDQIVASNIATTETLSRKLAELNPGKIEYGSAGWETAQTVVESLRMPAGGFACIIDESGNILCHPDMRKEPDLRSVNLGDTLLHPASGEADAPLAALPSQGVSSGAVTFWGVDTHDIATTALPGMGARLLAHQPRSGLLSAGDAVTGGLLWTMLGAGTIVLLTTAMATRRIMSRHDRELESINTGLEGEVARRVDQAMGFRDALILGLAKLADYRDTETGTHLDRIAEYSELLARELARSDATIDEGYIRRLRVASSMHDIGKVGVEDAVLLKPGKLTDSERARMQRHPVMGADTLLAIRNKLGHDELIDMAVVVTLEHHERWDGKGYPLGLEREQIQLPARIVALADVYDALTSRRVYKAAMSHSDATAIIMQGRGTQFDPAVVDAFARCASAFADARNRLQPPEDPFLTQQLAA